MISVVFYYIRVVVLHVNRVIFAKLKIFCSIVRFNAVLMMYVFSAFKFSSKKLFHDVSVMKDSLAVYIYTKITKCSKKWGSFLEIVPFGRNIIISVSVKSAFVHLTNTVLILAKNIVTTCNNTNRFYFVFLIGSFVHKLAITCGEINVKSFVNYHSVEKL